MPILSRPNISSLHKNRDIKGLIRAMEYPEDIIRQQAATALAEIGEPTIPLLQRAMQNSAINVRIGVMNALAEMRIPQAAPNLSEGLKDPGRLVRLEAARGLGLCKSDLAITVLQEQALTEQDAEILVMLYESIAHLGGSDGPRELLRLLESDDYNIRLFSTQSLSNIGEPAIEYLLLGLKSGHAIVRFGCANALGKNRSPKAVIPLIQTLTDPDEGVQKAAQEALMQYGSIAAHYLSQALRTKNQLLQQSVIRVLKKMPGFSEAPLIHLLDDTNSDVVEMSLGLLGQIGSKNSITPISKLAVNENISIRYAAIEALARIGTEECIPYLITALNDPDQYIANIANNDLHRLQQETEDPKIQGIIATALQGMENQPSLISALAQVNLLLEELISIAHSERFIGDDTSLFDSLSRHIRAREIGIQLFKLDGHRLMQSTWSQLEKQIDEDSMKELLIIWKEISGWNAI